MIHKINPQVNKQDTLNHLTACNSDYVVYLIKCKCNNIYTGGEGKYECVLVNKSITSWGTIGTNFFNPEPCSDRFFHLGQFIDHTTVMIKPPLERRMNGSFD